MLNLKSREVFGTETTALAPTETTNDLQKALRRALELVQHVGFKQTL